MVRLKGDSMVQQKGSEKLSIQEALQEERYLWMARAFSLVALLALVADILMLIALSGLNPLVRVQPFYVQAQSKEHQVISIVRPSKEELSNKILQESLVREYLLARFGVSSDPKEMEERWGIDGAVFAMSVPSVFQDFDANEARKTLVQVQEEGLTRDVKIGVVSQQEAYSDGSSVWVAEIETTDMSQKISDSFSSKWRVTMEVAFQADGKNREWSQRLKNPLGFKVTKFGRKHISENT